MVRECRKSQITQELIQECEHTCENGKCVVLCNDSDEDNVCDENDICPNTKLSESVDENGCSNPQFCHNQAVCGTGCDLADWKNNEPLKNPHDCITVIIYKSGEPQPTCAGLTCAD